MNGSKLLNEVASLTGESNAGFRLYKCEKDPVPAHLLYPGHAEFMILLLPKGQCCREV